MEIILGQRSGFCYGVKNAVEKAYENTEKFEKIYCLGELVHNEQLVGSLEKRGMITVKDISEVPSGEKVIFRSHGISKDIYELAKQRNIEIIDLTCPTVLSVHNKVENYAKDGYIMLLGEIGHPECIATCSFAQYISTIENEEDIVGAISNLKKSKLNKVYIVAQTTFSMEKFDIISKKIVELLTDREVIVDKTICNATKLRQEETESIAKNVQMMIIIGGIKSANTRKLYDISVKNCENAILVQTKEDIDLEKVRRFNKIGIMAGASTPKEIVDDIIEYIKI